VERKLLRRRYHTLRALGDAALAPPVADAKEVAA
jgi:transposase